MDFSVHFEVVALVKRGTKWINKESYIHTNCLIIENKQKMLNPSLVGIQLGAVW